MTIQAADPATATADVVRNALRARGYVVVRGVPVDPTDGAASSAWLLTLARQIGVPVSHDELGTLVWDIRKRQGATGDLAT